MPKAPSKRCNVDSGLVRFLDSILRLGLSLCESIDSIIIRNRVKLCDRDKCQQDNIRRVQTKRAFVLAQFMKSIKLISKYERILCVAVISLGRYFYFRGFYSITILTQTKLMLVSRWGYLVPTMLFIASFIHNY